MGGRAAHGWAAPLWALSCAYHVYIVYMCILSLETTTRTTTTTAKLKCGDGLFVEQI